MPTLKIEPDQLLDMLLQLEPDERIKILLKLAEPARARMEEHRAFAEQQLRTIAAERGLKWDTMSEEERETFIDELLHEP